MLIELNPFSVSFRRGLLCCVCSTAIALNAILAGRCYFWYLLRVRLVEKLCGIALCVWPGMTALPTLPEVEKNDLCEVILAVWTFERDSFLIEKVLQLYNGPFATALLIMIWSVLLHLHLRQNLTLLRISTHNRWLHSHASVALFWKARHAMFCTDASYVRSTEHWKILQSSSEHLQL